MRYENLEDIIGNTPVLQLKKAVPENSPHRFWAKLEYLNPGGSLKDRMALSIIEGAEKRGDLKPGSTIVENTSGNTGAALAMLGALRGYKVTLVMPDKISREKIETARAYGAEVVITPYDVKPDDPRSYYSVAKKIAAETPNSFYVNQYHNPDNPAQHYRTTGPEIWKQMDKKVDMLVAGAGTGGAISGAGKYLKEQNPNIKLICNDPVGSILAEYSRTKKITEGGPYLVEGIGDDMIAENIDFDLIDEFISIDDQSGFDKTRELAKKEGLMVGPSSGHALVGAIKASENITTPMDIVIIFADNGRQYTSKAFNEEWLKEKGLL